MTELPGAFAAHQGQVVDTQGDSFFVAFRTAATAVAAAVDAQRDLAAHVVARKDFFRTVRIPAGPAKTSDHGEG